MQTLTTATDVDIDQLRNLISQQQLSPRERKARQYITTSFTGKMPSLIPFALTNSSVINVASYLLKYTAGSRYTLYQYVFGIYRFSQWLSKNPDTMIREILIDPENKERYLVKIDEFIGDLHAQNLAPGTINNHVKGVKALFKANHVTIDFPFRLSKKVKYHDRAPTPEELATLIDIAALREKVIISLLALTGIRIGTLVKLQYRHVKRDFEAGVTPIHIPVEADITKGKYHAYDTFLGHEGVHYLKVYLDARRRGNERIEGGHKRGMPPEAIYDTSPLIRNKDTKIVKRVTPNNLHHVIHQLFFKAGLIQKGDAKRYQLRVHSLRKYFRTQLGSISTIPTDYIEYMMGHTISTYNDIRMKGIEHLRNLYTSSGLSIRPKTKMTKIERLKLFAESLGLNPDEVLSRDALVKPHRTVISKQRTIHILNQALKDAILMELQ
jgi:integrase